MRPGQLQIRRFLIMETGTFNQQWNRPYHSHFSPMDVNSVVERVGQQKEIAPAMMSGIASHLLRPQPQATQTIGIPEGWGTKRMRFMMEIEFMRELGIKGREIVMGYTTHFGAGHQMSNMNVNPAIDPNMEFIVNSTLVLQDVKLSTHMGNQMSSTITDASHVLANNGFNGVLHTDPVAYRMRPEDVFAAMTLADVHQYANKPNDIADGRTLNNAAPVKSRRANNLPTNYVSNLLNGYVKANDAVQFGQGQATVYGHGRGLVSDSLASRDIFLSNISQVRGSPLGNRFTMRDLKNLDPNADHPSMLKMVYLGETRQHEVHHTGQTAEWSTPSVETVIATQLSQMVPSLMMETGLMRLSILTSNHNIQRQPLTECPSYRGFVEDQLDHMVNIFIQRFNHEIISDLTHGNQVGYWISMNVDLLGETRITINWDGNGSYEFATPSFCDALLVPVISFNHDAMINMARDVDSLASSLVEFQDGNSNSSYAPQHFQQPQASSIITNYQPGKSGF